MKKIITLVLLVLTPFVFAQLRNNIAIIRPRLDPALKEDFSKLQKYFEERGVSTLAAYFQAIVDGAGFGSGFIVQRSGNTALVLTNRHVVATAKTATVEFELEGGQVRRYDDCQVVWIDDKVDLALVRVVGADLPPALVLARALPADGEEVWSAGFPGLLGRPSWQLARGNVTNRSVVVEELGPPVDAVFIQHSAPISPGNSGGPLLTGTMANPASLRVVGVNTWTAGGRANTFFAVPLSKINQTLASYNASLTNPESVLPPGKLQALRSFLEAPQWNPTAFQGLVSNLAGLQQGWPLFEEGLRTMPTAERNRWVTEFIFQPIEVLRKYLSLAMYQSFEANRKGLGVFATAAGQGPDQAQVSLSVEGKTWEWNWTREGGSWKIASFVSPQAVATAAPPPPDTVADPLGWTMDFYPTGFIWGAGASFSGFTDAAPRERMTPFAIGLGFSFGYTGPLVGPFLGWDARLQTTRLLPDTVSAWEFITLEVGPSLRLTGKDRAHGSYFGFLLSARALVGFPNILAFFSKPYGSHVFAGIAEVGIEVKQEVNPWGIKLGVSRPLGRTSAMVYHLNWYWKFLIR